MSSPSPWSRGETPSITVPTPALDPLSSGRVVRNEVHPQSGVRLWVWATLVLVLVAATSAVGGAITYSALNDDTHPPASSTPPSGGSSSPPVAPRFSAAETAAAKDHLCQVFNVSVRGQEGQGGLRVEGNLNIPMVLRALNSASVVQNALIVAVPAEVSAPARSYISATLDQTTAAMGNTPTSEVNRLTDVRNDAMFALLDTCGLPR
jgi:hypothetical protein